MARVKSTETRVQCVGISLDPNQKYEETKILLLPPPPQKKQTYVWSNKQRCQEQFQNLKNKNTYETYLYHIYLYIYFTFGA